MNAHQAINAGGYWSSRRPLMTWNLNVKLIMIYIPRCIGDNWDWLLFHCFKIGRYKAAVWTVLYLATWDRVARLVLVPSEWVGLNSYQGHSASLGIGRPYLSGCWLSYSVAKPFCCLSVCFSYCGQYPLRTNSGNTALNKFKFNFTYFLRGL